MMRFLAAFFFVALGFQCALAKPYPYHFEILVAKEPTK
jgi:hypothetical protein